ncbi:MAG: phosphatase PAP2 family protein [Fimbriimonadales bacterium]
METLLDWDRQVFFWVNHGLNHPWLNPVMWLITSLGLGWVQMLMVLSATLAPQRTVSGWRLGRRWRSVFFPALVAFVGSGITVQVIKKLVPRLRPSNLPEALVAPDERIFYGSFPSGHTTTAFAIGFWVWLCLRKTRYAWVGWAVMGLAGLVGLSRIYRGVHYPLDVLAGAALGMVWGWVAYRFGQWLNSSRRQESLRRESPPLTASRGTSPPAQSPPDAPNG